MPTIQKLTANLTQSQQWGESFRHQIKRSMEELTTKNQQIAQACRTSIHLQESIRKAQTELKSLVQQRQRNGYKRDKLFIKLEQLQARISVYQEGLTKKTQWNKELRVKCEAIQKAIEEHENVKKIEEMFEAVSQSKISVSSFSSLEAKSQKSSSKSSVHPMIDSNLTRLIRLQERYHDLTSRYRLKEEQLDRQKKRQINLKNTLKQMSEQESTDDKQNMQRKANPAQKISKETRNQLTKVKQLQDRNAALTVQLQQERIWIDQYAKHLEALTQCETQAQAIRLEVAVGERQAKKERRTVETICSYILKEIQL